MVFRRSRILAVALIVIVTVLSACSEKIEENPFVREQVISPVNISDKALIEKPLVEWSQDQLKMVFNGAFEVSFYPASFLKDSNKLEDHQWQFGDFSTSELTDYEYNIRYDDGSTKKSSTTLKDIDIYLFKNYGFNDLSDSYFYKLALRFGILDNKLVATLGYIKGDTPEVFDAFYISQNVQLEDGILNIKFDDSHRTMKNLISKLPSIEISINTKGINEDLKVGIYESKIVLDGQFENDGYFSARPMTIAGKSGLVTKFRHFTSETVEKSLHFKKSPRNTIQWVIEDNNL